MILERETQDVHSRRSSIEPCEARRWYRLPREKPRRGAFKVIDARCRQAGQDKTIGKSVNRLFTVYTIMDIYKTESLRVWKEKLSDLPKTKHIDCILQMPLIRGKILTAQRAFSKPLDTLRRGIEVTYIHIYYKTVERDTRRTISRYK